MKKAIFLDRDGTLIKAFPEEKRPALSVDEVELNDSNVIKGLKGCRDLDYLLIGATNQSGIGRGDYTAAQYYNVNEKMETLLLEGGIKLDNIFHCPHDRDYGCNCRKPGPGMLITAAEKYNIDLSKSFMVGDGFTDIGAGQAARVSHTFLIGEGWGEGDYVPDFKVKDLIDMLYHIEVIENGTK
jgi:D-glycero-D-manno-heptose 1,7-bisphosphate phosphatase